MVMTDDTQEQPEYTQKAGARLYNFPLSQASKNSQFTLHSLKMQKYFPLLKSSEAVFGECLSHDSYF